MYFGVTSKILQMKQVMLLYGGCYPITFMNFIFLYNVSLVALFVEDYAYSFTIFLRLLVFILKIYLEYICSLLCADVIFW